jgi:hypothetical protein
MENEIAMELVNTTLDEFNNQIIALNLETDLVGMTGKYILKEIQK